MNKDPFRRRSVTNYDPSSIVKSHSNSPLEWWFVHGYFEGNAHARHYFMTSFFRHRLNGSHDAHSWLLARLDTGRAINETVSRIDRSLIDQFANLDSQLDGLDLDSNLVKIYIHQYQKSEPPREFELDDSPVNISFEPLSIQWSDFSLGQRENLFGLNFKDPASETLCQFTLSPDSPKSLSEVTLHCHSDLRGMEYFSYPHLRLNGLANGAKVKGEAWLDHQWGNFGWLVESSETKKILGWDWFGLHLDDGSAWVFIAHRDARTGDILDTNIVFRDTHGKVRSSSNLCHQPTRFWESPGSAIRYPVEWQIKALDFNAEFTFSAVHDDQEIRIFGPIRSIWEGAGHVAGTLAGKTVKGWGRGELHGYGYIFDYRDLLGRLGDRVNRHIEDFIPKKMDAQSLEKYLGSPTWDYEPEAYTEMLSVPIWNLISRNGKRWRPIFAIFLLDALGKNPQPYESLVSNLAELAHSGSLIIDDIQDNSLLRRGDACIHTKYGEDVAISVANSLYFLSFHLLFGHPHLNKMQQLEIYEIIIKFFTRAHFGQAQDIYWTRNLTKTNLNKWMSDSLERKIFQMYQLKTASPLEGLAEAAVVIAGANDSIRKTCLKFAQSLGIAFQIIDDINNFSSSSKWRKKQGEDISEGKITYVIASALKELKTSKQVRLEEILTNKKLRKDPGILDEAVNLVIQSGALEKCHRQALEMVKPGWQHLDEVLEPSEPKMLLQAMYHSLLNIT